MSASFVEQVKRHFSFLELDYGFTVEEGWPVVRYVKDDLAIAIGDARIQVEVYVGNPDEAYEMYALELVLRLLTDSSWKFDGYANFTSEASIQDKIESSLLAYRSKLLEHDAILSASHFYRTHEQDIHSLVDEMGKWVRQASSPSGK